MYKVVLVALCLVATVSAQLSPSETFEHSSMLDNNGNMMLWWNLNDTHITFELQGRTTGWIGLGFSPNGGMANADIYVGWVANGQASITDRHGASTNTFPPLDAEQNVQLLGGLEQNGWTRVKFTRPIVACDSDDMTITSDTMKVIYAFGSADGPAIPYHGPNRGTRSLIVLTYATSGNQAPAGETTSHFDLLNDNFAVPAVDTYYNCRILQIPASITTKQHVVQVAPVIQAGNENHVHHILLYQCDSRVDASQLGQDSLCYTQGSPPCRVMMAAWAIGASAFNFPNHVGLPIGEADSPKFVLMETHYDNPTLKTDIVDSSGLRIIYTPNLRQHDAGIMLIGHLVSPFSHIIPPNAQTYLDVSECNTQCLSGALAEANLTSINAIACELHSHLLGRSVELKHIRNGVELPPIARDVNYDFNYQETRTLPQEITVRPEDTLQMVCNYDSSGRSNVTYGGFGTYQEMCMAFLIYYPKVKLTDCSSTPSTPVLLGYYFGIYNVSFPATVNGYTTYDEITVEQPPALAGKTVAEVINEIPWNETIADGFSAFLDVIPHEQRCHPLRRDRLSINLTRIDTPYVEPPNNCSTTSPATPSTSMATGTVGVTLSVSTTSGAQQAFVFSSFAQLATVCVLLLLGIFLQ